MLAQAHELGVFVETGAEVTEVIVESGRARGAVLADGSIRRAKAIAANLAPKHLYLDLIDRDALEADFRKRIERSRTESAVLRINVRSRTCRNSVASRATELSVTTKPASLSVRPWITWKMRILTPAAGPGHASR